MKKLFVCLSYLVCSLFLFSNQTAFSRDYVIAVSPYMKSIDAKKQAIEILKFLTTIKPDDTALLIDGYHLTILGEFQLPTNSAYHNPKAILGVNRATVGALMRFANSASIGNHDDVRAVRLPQLLQYAANNFSNEKNIDVIVLGSPFYHDKKDISFSMLAGQIPTDSHLLASRRDTPFGTKDTPELLSNVRVHLDYNSEAVMQNDKHRYLINRFWTLYIEKQQGQLTTFTSDLPTLIKRVNGQFKSPRHNYQLQPSTKLEMISIRPKQSTQAIFERPLADTALSSQMRRKAEAVEIGLSWDCATCDLDLYARPFSGLQALYFNHTSSPEGRYWKDYRDGDNTISGYEIIAFNVPLDLQALQIAVNFYDGNASNGVSGKLRLSVSGNTYETTFHIEATEGNKGAGMNDAFNTGQTINQQTILFHPLQMVRVN